jgi:hypothetical protein
MLDVLGGLETVPLFYATFGSLTNGNDCGFNRSIPTILCSIRDNLEAFNEFEFFYNNNFNHQVNDNLLQIENDARQ